MLRILWMVQQQKNNGIHTLNLSIFLPPPFFIVLASDCTELRIQFLLSSKIVWRWDTWINCYHICFHVVYNSPSLWGQCRLVCALSPVAPQISHLWLKRIGHRILSPLRRTCARYTCGLSPGNNYFTSISIYSQFPRAIWLLEAHRCSNKSHSASASSGIWKRRSTDQSQPYASVLRISKDPCGTMTRLGMGSFYWPPLKAWRIIHSLIQKRDEMRISGLRSSDVSIRSNNQKITKFAFP